MTTDNGQIIEKLTWALSSGELKRQSGLLLREVDSKIYYKKIDNI